MKPYTTIAVFVFSLIALLQLLRFVQDWEVMVNGMAIPAWASGIVFVIAAVLAAMLLREARPYRTAGGRQDGVILGNPPC